MSEQTLLIPGTRSVKHLEEDLSAGDIDPSSDFERPPLP
jgi:aryl-alcohol dehydrogenase-like predicted oxidoreductase